MTNPESSAECDVFISYASEDRADVAEPLAAALADWGLSVWFDQAELRVGDSLRRRIDDGLRRCRFGVVVLSPAFFEKHWPNVELDGLAQREADGTKVLLPVWYKVSEKDVRSFSPPLAGRVAARWQEGLATVTCDIVRVVRPDRFRAALGAVLPLTQVQDANHLAILLGGTDAWNLGNENPTTPEELDLVAGFQRFVQDWIDGADDWSADDGVRMRFTLERKVRELQERGWRIFAERETRSSKTEPKEGIRVTVLALVREGTRAVVQVEGSAFLIHRPSSILKPEAAV